jgi:hypothetical protein
MGSTLTVDNIKDSGDNTLVSSTGSGHTIASGVTNNAGVASGTIGSGVAFPVGTAMNGPTFSAYKTVNQTIANNVVTKVLFETEDFDTNSDYTNSRFTPTVAGYYVLSAMVILGAGTFSRLHLHIYKNGATYRRMVNQEATSAVFDDWSGHGSLLVHANGSSDYFEVWMDQRASSTADNLSAGSGSFRSWFTGYMVRTG